MGTLQHIARVSYGASIILSGFLLTRRVVWNATRREYIYIMCMTFVPSPDGEVVRGYESVIK